MSRIENDVMTGLPQPRQRAHVGHEIVVTEGRPAFREEELVVAERAQLLEAVNATETAIAPQSFDSHHCNRYSQCNRAVALISGQ